MTGVPGAVLLTVPVTVALLAARYGPTTGPPLPATPCGVTPPVESSDRARSRLTRPLPESEAVPAASAVRARRPTRTSFEIAGWSALRRAAVPATIAADAEVPVTTPEPVAMSTPGAARNVSSPELEPVQSASVRSVAETPTTLARPAGYVAVVEASLPVAATRTAPFDQA